MSDPTSHTSTSGPPATEEDKPYKLEKNCHKEFSRSILKHKIEEFKAGKYSQRYIETYLDFVHLEGIIDNLHYLECKKQLQEIIK